MSTELGAPRRPETFRPEAGIASLAVPDATSELDEIKSKVHYLWFPYIDIDLIGPEGLRFRLGKGWSYYGVGIPGETLENYLARDGNKLLRCTAYPCSNIYYKETKFNMGEFTDQEQRTGNDLGAETPMRDRQQFAGVCASDFLGRYRDDYGARVLTPLIGMEGPETETAAELFKLVQPYGYKLTNLREETYQGTVTDEETLIFDLAEQGPADARIRAAQLDKTLAAKAHELRRIMRGGVLAALTTARRDWFDFLEQLSNTSKGQKGFKKGPSAYDRELAWLLGEPVPAAIVSQPQGDPEIRNAVGELKDNVTLLTQFVTQQATQSTAPAASVTEMQDLLAEIKREQAKLESERKRIEALAKKGAQQ